MDNKDTKDKHETATKLGAIFAYTCMFCLIAVVIAITMKFIFWLF